MRKILFLTIFYLVAVIPTVGFAAEPSPKPPITSIEDILNILRSIVNVMYTAFFIVAIMFIILAGFNYLTAKDDPEKIKSATRQIMWAAVAIAVVLMSVGVNAIIGSFLGAKI